MPLEAIPVDTVKEIDANGLVVKNLIRKQLANVATPQVFNYAFYMEALHDLPADIQYGTAEDPMLTDDAALFTLAGYQVKVVFSSKNNLGTKGIPGNAAFQFL